MFLGDKSILAKLFIIQWIIIGIFISTELLFRLVTFVTPIGRQLDINDMTHVPRPHVMFAGDPSSPLHNKLGYRGELPEKIKKPGELRVFVLGGSTVYNGHEEGDPPYTLPRALQESLRKRNKNIKVFNFGTVSSVTQQDLVKTIIDVVDYDPDLVIFYGAGNDFLNPEVRPGYPHRFVIYENNPLWSEAREFPLKESLILSSDVLRRLFYDHLFERFAQPQYYFVLKEDEIDNEKPHMRQYDSYVQAVLKTNRILKALNIPFLTVLQPLIHSKKVFSNDEKKFIAPELCQKCFQEFYSKAVSLFEEKEVNHLDLSRIFENEVGTVFRDDIHLSHPEKHRQRLVEKIEKYILTKNLL